MKKILYIHQYFKTPDEGGAIRSYRIAKGLVDRGNQVEMLTAHNKSIYEQKSIDGITVHYLPVPYSNEFSSFKRFVSFLKFVRQALKISRKITKLDLAFATSTPLSVGLIALWIKKTRKIPYVFEVRDLWPEAPIQLGIIRFPVLKLLTKSLEKNIYKRADKIIALSPGIEKGIRKILPTAEIHMIPNMCDMDFFGKISPKTQENNDFIIGYFGTFGRANHLEYVLDLAMESQKIGLSIKFRMYGTGAEEILLKEKVRQDNLKNVQFYSHRNSFEIRESMAEVDACITSFLKIPILETNSPNKFFDGMVAGKLSIVNTEGWLKDLVEENKCGFYIDPDHPEKFPDLIRLFIQDNALLEIYQANGRSLANRLFSKEILVGKVCDLMEN